MPFYEKRTVAKKGDAVRFLGLPRKKGIPFQRSCVSIQHTGQRGNRLLERQQFEMRVSLVHRRVEDVLRQRLAIPEGGDTVRTAA